MSEKKVYSPEKVLGMDEQTIVQLQPPTEDENLGSEFLDDLSSGLHILVVSFDEWGSTNPARLDAIQSFINRVDQHRYDLQKKLPEGPTPFNQPKRPIYVIFPGIGERISTGDDITLVDLGAVVFRDELNKTKEEQLEMVRTTMSNKPLQLDA